MKQTAIAAMMLLIACSANAENDDAEWRIGGSLSFSDYQRDDNIVEDAAIGFKAHAQYRFNSWIGVEGAFYVSPNFEGQASSGAETETSFTGVVLDAIGYLPSPIEEADLYLKAGYFNFYDVNLTGNGGTIDSGSDDGLKFGAGTALRVYENVGIRIEFDWYNITGAELWTVGIGAEYRF